MSSLWTPDGEHRVAPDATDEVAAPERAPGAKRTDAPGAEEPDLDALERELVSAPVDAIIANHCFGLFQLAALHLAQRPPNLPEARLAIDALGAIVEELDGRLGEATETLNGALAQVRLAFVERSKAPEKEASDSGESAPG